MFRFGKSESEQNVTIMRPKVRAERLQSSGVNPVADPPNDQNECFYN